jgi:hypothetical protein
MTTEVQKVMMGRIVTDVIRQVPQEIMVEDAVVLLGRRDRQDDLDV